jgi:hypothetical protein
MTAHRSWRLAVAVGLVAIGFARLGASQGTATDKPTQPAAAPPPAAAAAIDTFATERDSLMNLMLERIQGKENAPADSVFKNIKVLKGVPAGRMLRIMNVGWGKSLGVSCFHCHSRDRWEAEDKPQKQVTRDMAAMTTRINTEILPAIKNLRSEKPTVNCTTCHRGQRKPAQNL